MVGLRRVANPGVGREQSTAQAYPGGVGTPAGRTFSFSEATEYSRRSERTDSPEGRGREWSCCERLELRPYTGELAIGRTP